MNLIFVSSPQTEFAHERRELCYFVLTDPYLKQFFDVFLFEDLPANQRDPKRITEGRCRSARFTSDCLVRHTAHPTAKESPPPSGSMTFDTFGSLEELKLKVMQSLLCWQQDHNRRPLP